MVEAKLSRIFSSSPNTLGLLFGLRALDSLPLPQGLAATHAWVVYDSAVWETDLERDTTGSPADGTWWHAEGCPMWGTNIIVDVTVHVVQAGGGAWDILGRVGLVANPFWESATRPLTEPDVRIARIRLFK